MPNMVPGAPSLIPTTPGGRPGAAPLSPISHQAAGIQLGCDGCQIGPQLKDVADGGMPAWMQILGVMALAGLVILALNLMGRKK